jgi:oligosaccharide repeat unit polymerase
MSFVSFLFLIGCLTILYCEKVRWKNLVSPSALMAFSYIGATLFAFIGNIFFNYYIISDTVFFLLVLSLLTFWLPSLLFNIKHKKMKIAYKKKNPFIESFLLFLLLSVELMLFLNIIRGGYALGSEEFENAYSRGLIAHLLNLLIVFFAYFLCFKRKDLIVSILIILSFLLIFISGTKYHIIFPVLVWFIYLLFKNVTYKKMIRVLFFIIIIVFVFFTANYYIGFVLRETDMNFNFMRFILNHILKYISGGFISLSRILELNYVHLEFFQNKKMYFDPAVFISTDRVEATNVRGLLGAFLLSRGYFTTYIYFFMLGFIFNYSYVRLLKANNVFFFLVYSFFIAVPMLLSFFANYYTLLNIWEWAIFSFFISIILNNKILHYVFTTPHKIAVLNK